MPRTRSVNVALILVGAGLLIHVLNFARVLHGIQMMLGNPRWLAVHLVAPLLIAVILYALARQRNWGPPALLIVTLGLFAELCWQAGWLYQRSPDDMSLFLLPSFLIVRVLPLVLYMVALHLLYSRNRQ